jgi:hypothetical protein
LEAFHNLKAICGLYKSNPSVTEHLFYDGGMSSPHPALKGTGSALPPPAGAPREASMNNQDCSTAPIPAGSRQAERDLVLEPLISKIVYINCQLDQLIGLVEAKSAEITALFKAATLLTRERTTKLLDVSESTLDRETRKGALEEVIIDRRPRYSLIDLEIYVGARRGTRRKTRSTVKVVSSHAPPDQVPDASGSARNQRRKSKSGKNAQRSRAKR